MNAEILKKMKETSKIKVGDNGKVYFYENGKYKTSKKIIKEYENLELRFGGKYEILNNEEDRYGNSVSNILKIQVHVTNKSDEVQYLNDWDVKFFGTDGVEISRYNGGYELEDKNGFDLEPKLLPGASLKENIYIEYKKKSPMFVIAVDDDQFVVFFLNDGTDEVNTLM